jgi:uncharacterized protein DUF4349
VKALKNRRLVVAAVGAVAVVVVIGAVGALSPRNDVGEARAQSSLKNSLRPSGAESSANGGVAFTVGGMGNAPQGTGGRGAVGGATAAIAPATTLAAGPRIVKNGSIDVEVRKNRFGSSFARLTTIATNLGGFVSSSKTFESADVPNGTVTLRVPSDRFDELVRQVRGLGTVRAVSSSGEDVTAKFTDLRARLKALEAQRDQYLALLTKATSISDTLAVRDRLSQVQVEIEQLQGQLKLLDDQTSFATLAVNIAEPGHLVAEPERERSGWSKAGHDAVDGFVRGAQAIVAHSGATLLVLVCGAALAVLGRFGWRWVATRVSPADVAQEA